MKLVKEFVKFTVKELGLKSLPKNIKFEGDDYSAQHLTFGTYNPSTDEVVVVKGQRHPIDVLRTLAHELVHHKQREDGKELNGEDGSDIENEANAKAGELMRKFRKVRPEIFNVGPWGFHTNMENKIEAVKEIATSGIPQKIDEQYLDAFNAKLILTVYNKLSEDNKKTFINESVDRMIAVAYKMVTH
jgi:Zn-dependent peptidase ImmA (M78 family)